MPSRAAEITRRGPVLGERIRVRDSITILGIRVLSTMTSGPSSPTDEGPPQTPPGTDGGIQPEGAPQDSADEVSTDTETGSSQLLQNRPEDPSAINTQSTYSDNQRHSSRPGQIHSSLAAIPNPRGEDSTTKQRGTNFLVPHSDHISIPRESLQGVASSAIDAVRFVAFLAAISLPFLYLPILLFGVLDSARFTAVLLLVGLHAVSLTVGYQYEPQKPFGSD